jgi:glycosyltransferase involved in cell wall biosynthesis
VPADCPLVSIVTRTYSGRDRFLRQAILSVAHQTYPNIEHVIVEDGQETLRSVVDETARLTGLKVRYLPIEKAGRSAAGNAGLAAAQGRWCVFLDDDDLLFADHVEVLVQALLDAPDAVAAYSPALEVFTEYPSDSGGPYVEVAHTMLPSLRQPFDVSVLRHHNFMAIQSVLFERRLFQERGGFELDMHALEDWVLWNLYACRNTFVYVPKTTSLFRTPADVDARARRNATFVDAYEMARERIAMRLLAVNSHAMASVSLHEGRSPSALPQSAATAA